MESNEKEQFLAAGVAVRNIANDLAIDVYRPRFDGDESGNDASQVKSYAVDLHSVLKEPPKMCLLQSNTNLNRPPPNWLMSRPKKVVGPVLKNPKSSAFSSFRMASSFLDCVGEVDVVSDAENIKKLLKIPYSKGPVSMMVHRVGNSLLLDEFDIHTHLLRQAENEWSWLRKFYLEHIFEASLRSKSKPQTKSSRHSRDYLQQQNLISKFLHHSLAMNDFECFDLQSCDHNREVQAAIKDPIVDPIIHEANQPKEPENQFCRNVMWTFEDLRMLIGTDLPIFGGSTHPCLSLRLRDMNKPINVLTGLDYWLDNLMCNVPEVVMCYHLGGLVQKYELVKTDDLPHLPGSQFNPGIVKDVAQNILSFLKSKATKAGHTYWLFKGKDDDIVKLYDLTSLCDELNEDGSQNPFTTPVAMLLFKVARNLKMSSDWKRHQGTVLALLKNCLSILDTAKYPQVATVALYYMSDVYLPASPKSTENEETTEGDEENWDYVWDDMDKDEDIPAYVDVKALSTPQLVQKEEQDKQKPPQPTIGDDWEQRCACAIQHAVEALECIANEHRPKEKTPKKPSKNEPEPAVASPLKPIPMPYETLKTDNKGEKSTNNSSLISKEPLCEWKEQYWRLLVEKCYQAYVTLADEIRRLGAKRAHECLGHLRMAAHLRAYLDDVGCEPVPLQSYAYGVAGDVYFSVVQNWNQIEDKSPNSELGPLDEQLLKVLVTLRGSAKTESDRFPFPSSLQEALQLSLGKYQTALILFTACRSGNEEEGHSLAKRLGNVSNEIGMFLMSKATVLLEQGGNDWKRSFTELFYASRKHFEASIELFKKIKDTANTALLYCNLAKLDRLQASALAPLEKKEASIAEWKCHQKAMQCYKEALNTLENRDNNSAIWDIVIWDYTGVLFSLATLLQDYAPLSIKSREDIESEIVELLETCLTYCAGETSSTRLPLLQYRSATCHYRLATLYHYTYRNGNGESIVNGRNVRSLAEDHYSKACSMYSQLEHWDEVMRLQMEKIGLHDFQMQRLTGALSKVRTLRSILGCCLTTAPAVAALFQPGTDGEQPELDSKTLECMAIMQTKLQSTLLQLSKLAKSGKKPSNDADVYRKMYALSLKLTTKQPNWKKDMVNVVEELCYLQNTLERP